MGALRAIVVAILVRSYAMGEQGTGYQLMSGKNSQMKYEAKGPDGVTYGCYGYLDPNNQKRQTYYVVDDMGYRIIYPYRSTNIFIASGKSMFLSVVQWINLYMPESCFRLNEILDSAASNQVSAQEVERPQPSTSHVQVQPSTTRSPLPFPTQYVIPTTPRALVDSTGAGTTEQQTSDYNGNTRGGFPELPNTAGQSQSSTSQSNEKIAQLLIQMEAVNKQIIALNILMAGLTNNGTANTA